MGAKKNFVLDTNVILHDYKCIENFQENDIYLPIVVLEELDKFKKGSEQINYNAREFVRELDLLTSNDLFLKGASLGPGKGTLYIVTGDKYQEKIAHSFPDKTPDHRILSCALTIAEKNTKIKTTLVSKDVNLRMKARSLGIPVEDYITDKVVNVDIFERAQETYENIDPDLIDKIYSSPEGVDADSLDIKSKLDPNECFILKSVRNSVLAHRDSRGRDVAYEHTEFTSGKEIKQAASNAGIGLKYDYDATFFRFADYRTGEENAMAGAFSGKAVNITHSDHYKTSFRYDPQSRTYKMQMYSRISGKFENTVDELNAKQLSFDNLLVCFAPIERYSGDSGDVQQVSYISGGDAYYFSRGAVQHVRWEKASPEHPLLVYDKTGAQMLFNRGKTYLAIVDDDEWSNFSYQ